MSPRLLFSASRFPRHRNLSHVPLPRIRLRNYLTLRFVAKLRVAARLDEPAACPQGSGDSDRSWQPSSADCCWNPSLCGSSFSAPHLHALSTPFPNF